MVPHSTILHSSKDRKEKKMTVENKGFIFANTLKLIGYIAVSK